MNWKKRHPSFADIAAFLYKVPKKSVPTDSLTDISMALELQVHYGNLIDFSNELVENLKGENNAEI